MIALLFRFDFNSMNNSLLPPIYQKEIKSEKIMRVCLAFIFLVSVAFLVGIIFMLPSYFTLVFSRADVLRRLDAQERTFARQDTAALEQSIGTINKRAGSYQANEFIRKRIAPLLIHLATADTAAIKLSYLDLQGANDGIFTLTLHGMARTRDNLLEYIRRLKEVSEFAVVRSPISNLLRETDAPFELEIDLKKDAYFYVPKP